MAQKPSLTNRIYTSGKRQPPQIRGGGGGGGTPDPNNPQNLSYWEQGLSTPITADVGLSDQERRGIYNLARRQTQGATNAAAGEMEQKLSGKGFRAGESGIADTALGQIYSKGAEQLGSFGQQIASQEAKDRFAQNMELNNANLGRLTGGGGLALGALQSGNTLAGTMAQIEAAKRKAGGGGRQERTASGFQRNQDLGQQQLAWEKEKYGLMSSEEQRQFNETMGYNTTGQTMGFLNQYLQNQQNYENPLYNTYYNSIAGV